MSKYAAVFCLIALSMWTAVSHAQEVSPEQLLANRLANEIILAQAVQNLPSTDQKPVEQGGAQLPPMPLPDVSETKSPAAESSSAAAPAAPEAPAVNTPTTAPSAANFNAPGAPPVTYAPGACGFQPAVYAPCPACDCCLSGPPGTYWVRDEYVGWWANGGHLPALVATNPSGTLPTNTTLFGNDVYNGDYRPGVWTKFGMWLDCCRAWGFEADYFYVGRESSTFFASSDGDPVLTRPFIDATTGDPSEQLVAFPGSVVGSVSVNNFDTLSGAGFDFRRNLCCCGCNCCDPTCYQRCDGLFRSMEGSRLDLLLGFRYYGFYDNLSVNEQLTSISLTSGIPVGTQFNITDSFRTLNNFYGFEIGLDHEMYKGSWYFEGIAKVALGSTQQLVHINGSTIVSFPGQPTVVNQGGLLALSSNIGNYSQEKFAAVPMISGRIGYRLTERLTFLVGYTFIYMGQVVRAGDQIDTTINPNFIPPATSGGPNRPAFAFHDSNLFLQGITLGAEYHF